MATVLIDNQSRYWVWDPWVNSDLTLLTIEQWLYKENQPHPTKCMIAHQSVISDHEEGRRTDAHLFRKKMKAYFPPEFFNAFQAVCVDALPNPPARSLSYKAPLNRYGLFASPCLLQGHHASDEDREDAIKQLMLEH